MKGAQAVGQGRRVPHAHPFTTRQSTEPGAKTHTDLTGDEVRAEMLC